MTNLGAKKWNEFLESSESSPDIPTQSPVNIRDLLRLVDKNSDGPKTNSSDRS